MESYWNFRQVRHINSKWNPQGDEETIYTTVHEVYWDADGKPHLWNPNKLTIYVREDLEKISKAFDHEPVVEVDDASLTFDEYGTPDYKVWKWLVEGDSEPTKGDAIA